MAIKNNKISAIIEEQIPDFIREEHDNFVQFLKSYYEFLESESPPTRIPLIVDNPFPTIYNPIDNPYGGQFQIGETIQQKANSDDPTEVTASAKVFAWSGDATAQTAIITSFGGTSKTFIKDVEIVGEKSGVKFFPVDNTESLSAGSTRASLDLLDTKDIDNTLDDYVQYIKNEFAVNLPLTLHENTDTRKTLKNIRDFYKARGTENSFKFLFRLLYGEDISIYLPETDMLRASDANWKNVTVIRVAVDFIDPRTKQPVTTSDLVGRKIKGESSEASAIVEKATEIVYAGARFSELELSDKLGTFVANENIETDNVGDGTIVRAAVLGLMNSVNITEPGSNYAPGDRVVVNSSGGGVGAIAEVATTNATSGAITSMKIIDPGYNYASVPTLDMTTPHNADAGAARFEAGPLETIFYNDFSQYTDANSFFAESDNRGANSVIGPSIGHPYENRAYDLSRAYLNPASVTPNSIFNFTTVPGVDEGLKGYWKMNSYYPKDVTISTADATANSGNDPTTDYNVFKGPRVGDVSFFADPLHDSLLDNQLNYIDYGSDYDSADRRYGFRPVVFDESGKGHHAYTTAWYGGTGFAPVHNLDFQDSLTPAGGTQAWNASPSGGGTLVAGTTSATFTEGTGNDPQLWAPPGEFSFKGSDYTRVTLRMRLLTAATHSGHTWAGQMFYEADGSDSFVGGASTRDADGIPEPVWGTPGPNAEWKLVSWDLKIDQFGVPGSSIQSTGTATDWMDSQTIDQLRWDFYSGGTGGTGNIFEIDWLQIDDGTSLLVNEGAYIRRPSMNLFSESAFSDPGIFGTGSGNALGTFGEGGLVLMPHDDISSANTQTWSFWFNPSAKPILDSLSTGKGKSIGDGSEMIVSRDHTGFWGWSVNAYSSSAVTTGEYIDTLFSFPHATFDNGNPVGNFQKLANSAGYYPGTNAGLYAGGGTVRANMWNMFTLTIDYTNLVANVYIFNTTDGLLVANGFTLDANVSSSSAAPINIAPRTWSTWDFGDDENVEFTDKSSFYHNEYGSAPANRPAQTRPHQFYTLVRADLSDGAAYWPGSSGKGAGSNTALMHDQLQSSTAGTGNTARVQIVHDRPTQGLVESTGAGAQRTSNSYITGRALNIRVSSVDDGSGSINPSYILVHSQNNHPTQHQGHASYSWETSEGVIRNLPTGKKWIVSYYVKGYRPDKMRANDTTPTGSRIVPYITVSLKKSYDGINDNYHEGDYWSSGYQDDIAGTAQASLLTGNRYANDYYSSVGSSNSAFVGSGLDFSSDGQGSIIAHEDSLDAYNSPAVYPGEWRRKWQFIDLSLDQPVWGYGGSFVSTQGLRKDDANNPHRRLYENYFGTITSPGGQNNGAPPALNGVSSADLGEVVNQDYEDNAANEILFLTAPVSGTPHEGSITFTNDQLGVGLSFDGSIHNIVHVQTRANNVTGSAVYPDQPDIADFNMYDTAARWNYEQTHSDNSNSKRSILRWTTTTDGTMGGSDGRQSARCWSGRLGGYNTEDSSAVYDASKAGASGASTAGSYLNEYWRMHRIPEWRNRTITGITIHHFDNLSNGDKYDFNYIVIGKSKEPNRNEVDTMSFRLQVSRDAPVAPVSPDSAIALEDMYIDTFIDGLMVEEAAPGQTTPSDYVEPHAGAEIGQANKYSVAITPSTNPAAGDNPGSHTVLTTQGRAVVLGQRSESANGDSFQTEAEQAVHGNYDEVRYYDKALSWAQVESLFYNPGGRFDKVLSGDWKALNQGTNFFTHDPTTVEFIKDEVYEYDASDGVGIVGGELPAERIPYAGGGYLRIGSTTEPADGRPDGLHMWTTKNIPFDPTVRYKMSVRAKDGSDSTESDAVIGLMGISNTGLNIIGGSNRPDWYHTYRFIQSQADTGSSGNPSSLGPGWFTYSGVYGGNTALGKSGWKDNPGVQSGHGGNTAQSLGGPSGAAKLEYNWANPVRLFGDPSHATSNVAFVRPTLLLNYANQDDQTLIDYIKIEQQKDATLTAEIGAEFKQAGEYLDDSGKIGTSPVSNWRPKFIQDDRFYQIYSYVIKSGLSIGTYNEIVKKLVHPAGLIMFGKVDIQTVVSVTMNAFNETFSGEILDLLRAYYMGAESSTLFDYADVPISGRGVTYHARFGLNNIAGDDFDLDSAHGVNPHGAGRHTPGSPGWIAWDQSPLASPYANSHYYANSTIQALDSDLALWPYTHPAGGDNTGAPYTTSNAYTTVTNDSLIWHIKGFRTILASAFENANSGVLSTHGVFKDSYSYTGTGVENQGYGQKGWAARAGNWSSATTVGGDEVFLLEGLQNNYHEGFGMTAPLDIDGNLYRYVRMKIRRIGPGGYGADSWLGACQPETYPATKTALWTPTASLTPTQWNAGASLAASLYGYTVPDRTKYIGSANTAQPSTLIIPADASPNTKSPWHILEWNMELLGELIQNLVVHSPIGGADTWITSDASTGGSPQDGETGTRIGNIGFHLCYEPDNGDEKFEIEWIQVDDGTGWPRGSYVLPGGYANTWTSATDADGGSLNDTGTGTGGVPYRKRASESTDFSNQTIGDFSVTVAPAATAPSEISTGAPVLYVHSDKSIRVTETDQIFDANGAIFRVSANTANNLDWVVTEIIDSEKFLRNAPGAPTLGAYVGADLAANGFFSGPVILDTDVNDNLYVGYLYEDDAGGYPGFTNASDSKPLMLFRLTPTANVQTDISESADPHNLRSVGSTSPARGRSNTYSAEQILWGNTGGTDGVGVMIGGNYWYGTGSGSYTSAEIGGASGSFVDFSTDDLGSLYVVGSGSHNIIKILPAANGSYANGVTKLASDLVGQLHGRGVFEIANTTTLDANNDVLGFWRPTNIIPGPKDSLFVACDTGYDPTNRGANSVYCYHVVTEQNIATGEYYTKNVYPVFANTQSSDAYKPPTYGHVNNVLEGMQQKCAGMVLDHEDPPNLYYMTANNMYRIKPKGYSYQIGDTEIEQVFPEDYFHNELNYPNARYNVLGFSRSGVGDPNNPYIYYQSHYQRIQVDSRNRIYFGGMANLYCYSRGSNTDLLLFNQSNTEFSTLQVVVNTAMYTSNINFNYGTGTDSTPASIESFVLGAKTSNSAFTGGDPGNPSTGANNFSEGVYITMHSGEIGSGTQVNGRRLIAIYPNANGSFVESEGGQLAMTIMNEDPAANTKFAVDGTGGVNKFRGIGPGKVVLRPEKV